MMVREGDGMRKKHPLSRVLRSFLIGIRDFLFDEIKILKKKKLQKKTTKKQQTTKTKQIKGIPCCVRCSSNPDS